MKFKSKQNNLIKPRTVVVDSLKYKTNGFALSFIFQALLLCVTLVGFLYSVSTSAQMTVGILPIIAIAVPVMVIAMLFTLNNKVFIAFISVFVASCATIMLLLRDLRIKIVDSFLFYFFSLFYTPLLSIKFIRTKFYNFVRTFKLKCFLKDLFSYRIS